MTLLKAQRIIQNMRYGLSITNAGLNRLDEKQALDTADTIIDDELNKRKGCEYCNEEINYISIKYKEGHWDYSTNAPKFCFNCGRKLQRPIIEFTKRN